MRRTPEQLIALGIRLTEHVSSSTPGECFRFIGLTRLSGATELILLGIELGQRATKREQLLTILEDNKILVED